MLAQADGPDVASSLIGAMFGALIGSLIAAVFLRAAASWVLKKEIKYGDAYFTMFLSNVIAMVVSFVGGFMVGLAGATPFMMLVLQIVLIPISLLITSGLISLRHQVSFGMSVLTTLAILGIAICVGAVIAIPIIIVGMLVT